MFAWFCANGAIWDLAQVFAWTKMFAGYSESMPLAAAVSATFDPGKPCNLCRAIAKAKKSDRQELPRLTEKASGKLILAIETSPELRLNVPPAVWPELEATSTAAGFRRVPVPPPRA